MTSRRVDVGVIVMRLVVLVCIMLLAAVLLLGIYMTVLSLEAQKVCIRAGFPLASVAFNGDAVCYKPTGEVIPTPWK